MSRSFVPHVASLALVSLALLSLAPARSLRAQEVGPDPGAYKAAVDKGIAYLAQNGQAEDGSFSKAMGSGPSALAITAMLRHGHISATPTSAER